MGAILALSTSFAGASSVSSQLLKLDPKTRLEQRCNARAMGAIQREHKGMDPDELVAYSFSDPVTQSHFIKAEGAAVRTGGEWYHLSYECRTTDDNMTVTAFKYELGGMIPHAQWTGHYLVPR